MRRIWTVAAAAASIVLLANAAWAAGRGDNRDDRRSGRVDRPGDGNSGQGDDLHRPDHPDGDRGACDRDHAHARARRAHREAHERARAAHRRWHRRGCDHDRPRRDGDGPGGGRGRGPRGNNGVGNGIDPQPPGNPPPNDGPGTGPGNPGNRGGRGPR